MDRLLSVGPGDDDGLADFAAGTLGKLAVQIHD